MKRLPVTVVAAIAFVGVAGCRRIEHAEAPSVTAATFDQQVLKNPKPVLVEFSATW